MTTKTGFDKVVEVFGLFGYRFQHSAGAVFASIRSEQCIYATDNGLMFYGSKNGKSRWLSVDQVKAIGELKRLEIERDKLNNSESPNSSDEWPQVGSIVRWCNGAYGGRVKALDGDLAWIKSNMGNYYVTEYIEKLTKPKTSEEKLRDELVIMRNKTEEHFIDALLNNFKLIRKGDKA